MGGKASRRRGGGHQQFHIPDAYEERQSHRKARNNVQEKSGYGKVIPFTGGYRFEPLNDRQRILASTIKASDCTFATGPAGTGKTHVAIASNIDFLRAHKDNKFILTNPGVEIGQKLGILPGDKDDKIAVSVRPMRDILHKILGASTVEAMIKGEKIFFEPLGSILGTTFDDAIILLDEAQNATPEQMKALLTRTGQRSKIVIAGDYKEQQFVPGISGLEDALCRLRHLPTVGHVEFTSDDIVRSGFCKDVILAYREDS